MTYLDMKVSMGGVFTRSARESVRLPGLMATAVILLRLGSFKQFQLRS